MQKGAILTKSPPKEAQTCPPRPSFGNSETVPLELLMVILGMAMWSSHLLMVSSHLLMVAAPMAVRIVAMEMLAANLGLVAVNLAMLTAKFLDRSPHLLGSTLARSGGAAPAKSEK